jgi:NTP pyrophosphatase (non-canonical NTP hydrolase)
VKVKKELGDVLWHLSQIANDNDFSLSEIAALNIAKLTDRKKRDVIIGSGDER